MYPFILHLHSPLHSPFLSSFLHCTLRYVERHEFAFDQVFDTDTTTEEIYRQCCQPLVSRVFSGANATVFAYGQTGSGKTFTMMGPDTAPAVNGSNNGPSGAALRARTQSQQRRNAGLYVLAARDIFTLLLSKNYNHLRVHASFYEIYGGKLFDLLNQRRRLRCLEDAQKRAIIVGLREEPVVSVEELMSLIEHGHNVRSTGSTSANADSSRSHAVLQVSL